MANITLTPRPILDGYAQDFGHVTLREMTELSVVSLAIPMGGDDDFAKALKAGYKIKQPSPTMSQANGTTRIVQTAADQFLLFLDYDQPDVNTVVNTALKGASYTTDQTGNWVVIEMSGVGSGAVLERLCMLDTHPDVFTVGMNARTTMEHMGALLVRTGHDSYLIASASSSAQSFIHALETSAAYTA